MTEKKPYSPTDFQTQIRLAVMLVVDVCFFLRAIVIVCRDDDKAKRYKMFAYYIL